MGVPCAVRHVMSNPECLSYHARMQFHSMETETRFPFLVSLRGIREITCPVVVFSIGLEHLSNSRQPISSISRTVARIEAIATQQYDSTYQLSS